MSLSEYEELRLANLKQNYKILQELGLAGESSRENSVDSDFGSGQFTKVRPKPKQTIRKRESQPLGNSNESDETIGRRKSERLLGVKRPSYSIDAWPEEFSEKRRKVQKVPAVWNSNRLDPSSYTYQKPIGPRENVYGIIEGVSIGTIFQSRMECNYAGIHRPPVSGIHGGPDGAYSVALSCGYEDDVDLGEVFTYTGEGGRDLCGTPQMPKNLRTAPQSKDQNLSRGNAALVKSVETRIPVRVVRGFQANEKFAPVEGYRYDGLYTVEKWWMQKGLSGFKVFRFAFKRLPKQGPFPWNKEETIQSNDAEEKNMHRSDRLSKNGGEEKE